MKANTRKVSEAAIGSSIFVPGVRVISGDGHGANKTGRERKRETENSAEEEGSAVKG